MLRSKKRQTAFRVLKNSGRMKRLTVSSSHLKTVAFFADTLLSLYCDLMGERRITENFHGKKGGRQQPVKECFCCIKLFENQCLEQILNCRKRGELCGPAGGCAAEHVDISS